MSRLKWLPPIMTMVQNMIVCRTWNDLREKKRGRKTIITVIFYCFTLCPEHQSTWDSALKIPHVSVTRSFFNIRSVLPKHAALHLLIRCSEAYLILETTACGTQNIQDQTYTLFPRHRHVFEGRVTNHPSRMIIFRYCRTSVPRPTMLKRHALID
jgi:hypothetical protein